MRTNLWDVTSSLQFLGSTSIVLALACLIFRFAPPVPLASSVWTAAQEWYPNHKTCSFGIMINMLMHVTFSKSRRTLVGLPQDTLPSGMERRSCTTVTPATFPALGTVIDVDATFCHKAVLPPNVTWLLNGDLPTVPGSLCSVLRRCCSSSHVRTRTSRGSIPAL